MSHPITHVFMLAWLYVTSLTILIIYSIVVASPGKLIGTSLVGCEMTLTALSHCGLLELGNQSVLHTIQTEDEIGDTSLIIGRCKFEKHLVFTHKRRDGVSEDMKVCSARDSINLYHACIIAASLFVVIAIATLNAFCTSRLRYARRKITDYYNLAGYMLMDTCNPLNKNNHNNSNYEDEDKHHAKDDKNNDDYNDDDDDDNWTFLPNGLPRDDSELHRRSATRDIGWDERGDEDPLMSLERSSIGNTRYLRMRENLEFLTVDDVRGTHFQHCSIGGLALRYADQIDFVCILLIFIALTVTVSSSSVVIRRYPHYTHKWLFYLPMIWSIVSFVILPSAIAIGSRIQRGKSDSPHKGSAARDTAGHENNSTTDKGCRVFIATCAGVCVGMVLYRIFITIVITGGLATGVYYLSHAL